MPLTITLEEEYLESRGVTVTRDSLQQDFIFIICGNFLEEALDDPVYGPDDDLVALAAAYSIIPPFRQVPTYDEQTIVLSLSSLSIKQLDNNTWKIEVSYDVGDTGGTGGGGYNSGIEYEGPNADESRKTNSYVQLSFNITATQVSKNMSLGALACQKAIGLTNQSVPYPQGQPAPIGQTIDGIEGGEVYEREFGFSLTAYFPPARLTYAYVRRLFRMATTVNDAEFMGFPQNSVLFLEADASSDLFQMVPVTFGFKVRPNFIFKSQDDTELQDPDQDDPLLMYDTVGDPYFEDTTNGIIFSGWNTIDYRYAPLPENASKMKLQKPVLRTIHQMYKESDFSRFEL